MENLDNESAGEHKAELLSVSVASRIAPFWKELPDLWFSQFDAIITPQKVG